jgi:type VI secretion system secreted protein VgrG
MTDDLAQGQRVAKLKTPLGDDVLGLARFDANEGLSTLFEMRIEAIGDTRDIDFKPALGRSCTVTLTTADGSERIFDGILAEARWAGQRSVHHVFRMVLRPWFWLLTKSSDCRIFSKKRVDEIIKKVFDDKGFSDYLFKLSGVYPELEYCVQYRETDFAFVSRLMEEYGIYYFFEYEDGKHTLVLADSYSSHMIDPDLPGVPYYPVEQGVHRNEQYLDDWSRGRMVESGFFALNDYDYRQPNANLLAEAGDRSAARKMFDYPGDYIERDEGERLADVKFYAADSLDNVRAGRGSALTLYPGCLVILTDHPVDAENQEYLVVRCAHAFDAQQFRSGGEEYTRAYVGNFEFRPSDKQFRAPQITPAAIVHGVQSALVVGEREIDVDKDGRILVQFYWDRKKKQSRRVRVAQAWAGALRGFFYIPRVGDEVLIQYEEGDPDRPIVVGSMNNAHNPVVPRLPDMDTRSGILSRSTPGGNGYNLFEFDDTAGSERVRLRSQKDLAFKALNNEKRDIGNNQTETIGGDETITVGSSKAGGNFTLTTAQTVLIQVVRGGIPDTSIKMDHHSIILTGPLGISSIQIYPDSITIKSADITISGDATVSVTAPMVKINS